MPRPSLRRTTRSPASRRRSRETSTADGRRSQTRLRLIGGKGGVGKTTCAAACALTAARDGLRTLVLSVDPAHSVGDVFRVRLGPSPTAVPATRGRVQAAELRPSHVMRRWLSRRRLLLEEIALRGTLLDRDDVSRLLQLALPGVDELAALLEIGRLVSSRRYDLIVVDTAPTGHALRMLDTPAALAGIAGVFDAMQARHRVLVQALRGRWSADAADALIADLEDDSRELAALLRDPVRSGVVWVTLPEPMAVEETGDALEALSSRSIPIEAVVVNRLTPPPPRRCRWCDARRRFETRALEQLDRVLRGRETRLLLKVFDREDEPVGVGKLASIGRDLEPLRATGPGRHDRRSAAPQLPRVLRTHAAPEPDPLSAVRVRRADVFPIQDTSARLLMFGGKGGVGKTTCAAAAALAIARAHPRKRVLLLSTDPAHSLSDVLGAPVSDKARSVTKGSDNLDVRELDAVAALRRMREEYATAIDKLCDRLLGGAAVDVTLDRRVLQTLVDLAPPGVDELTAMSHVVETIDAGAAGPYDLVVIDTAPTGHALRLLEMPDLVRDWTQALMRILLKYQPVTGVGAPGEALLRLSRAMGRLRAMLADRSSTEFIVVTRAAAIPRAETRRLLASLRRLRIPTTRMIINAANAGTCSRCQRTARAERRDAVAIVRSAGANVTVTMAPGEIPPPHGIRRLLEWQRTWGTWGPA